MEASASGSERVFLEELRRRRAELRESMSALEGALAAPANGDRARWAGHVHAALAELAGDLREHVQITEGADGMYADLLATSPRLSGPVESLTREHVVIGTELDELVTRVSEPGAGDDVDGVRERGTALLGLLVRHRQRGSDLVFEAYEFDLGGET